MTRGRGEGYIALALPPWRSGIFRLCPRFQTQFCSPSRYITRIPCSILLACALFDSHCQHSGLRTRWHGDSQNAAITAGPFVFVSCRRRFRGEGPGADVCRRNESSSVRTSRQRAEDVPAGEGQQPVGNGSWEPLSNLLLGPSPLETRELLQLRPRGLLGATVCSEAGERTGCSFGTDPEMRAWRVGAKA